MMSSLAHSFLARPAPLVAPQLLGCYLIKAEGEQTLVGRIVEVEAYLGDEDAASHAYRGLTARNRSMFGPPGLAYVYLIYGVHHCLNVVTGPKNDGQAVLIRAIEPLTGIPLMQERRQQRPLGQLTNGPGKLCQAFGIDRRFDGHDLTQGVGLWLAAGSTPLQNITAGPRIGVRGDDVARSIPWRFYLPHNPFVSATPARRLSAQKPG
ncbi:MAG: DNA-3-methyladenine glycosylase [Chloroflexi bacterium]|nr:DNA-3-methyladenine glycosylase [Chloroflexota bacterium]